MLLLQTILTMCICTRLAKLNNYVIKSWVKLNRCLISHNNRIIRCTKIKCDSINDHPDYHLRRRNRFGPAVERWKVLRTKYPSPFSRRLPATQFRLRYKIMGVRVNRWSTMTPDTLKYEFNLSISLLKKYYAPTHVRLPFWRNLFGGIGLHYVSVNL